MLEDIHLIQAYDVMTGYGISSSFNTSFEVFNHLASWKADMG